MTGGQASQGDVGPLDPEWTVGVCGHFWQPEGQFHESKGDRMDCPEEGGQGAVVSWLC